MDKEILSEINRYREILGQSLLTESAPPFNLLQQLFKMVGGSSDNLLSTVLKKSSDPQALKLKNQIDLVSRELGQSPNDLITKIQQDTLSLEEFDSLVASLMRTDEIFFKRLLKIYVENSPPLRQIDDLIGTLEKTLEERGIAPTADEIGDLQLQLFKTIDNDPKLGEDIKNIIKGRIAERLSKLPISTKKPINSSGKKIMTMDMIPQDEKNRLLNILRASESQTWKSFGPKPEKMSGWKFHVYGEDLYDSAYLYDRLEPLTQKWGAPAKVGVGVDFYPGTVQFGKKGVTIYIPPSVIKNNQVQSMFSDIQNAISGYKKVGTISGDKSITDNITYRYELDSVIPTGEGIPMSQYRKMYTSNTGGNYKPSDVPDLFTGKK